MGTAACPTPPIHRGGRTCVAQELAQRQQGPVDVLQGVGVAREAALGLLKQAVVPHHPVPRLPLLHQHQARLRDVCCFVHVIENLFAFPALPGIYCHVHIIRYLDMKVCP